MKFRVAGLAAVWSVSAVACYAQQAISARSGMVHYTEGRVYVAGQPVQRKFAEFPTIRPGEELRTEAGRAEVLLTPGAFLRVGDDSSVRMQSTELSDTRIQVLSGSVIVECDELLKDNAITLVSEGTDIRLQKHGLYRLDTNPARIRVFDGSAVIQADSAILTVKRGKELILKSLVAEKFEAKRGDTFDIWSKDRSSTVAMASVRAAQSLRDARLSWKANGWLFNSSLDTFTFVPRTGIVYSPFGWGFWSPAMAPYYGSYVASQAPVYSGGGSRSNGGGIGQTASSGASAGGVSGGGGSFGGRSGAGGGMTGGGGHIGGGGGGGHRAQ